MVRDLERITLKTLTSLTVLILLTLCAACAAPKEPPTPTLPPSPTPIPSPTPEPKVLTVCMPEEPESLYLYGTADTAARHVWQAIYDGPLDNRAYTYQPVILSRLPDLASSEADAATETVSVQSGDRVLAANGAVVELTSGMMVEDVDGRRVIFDDTPLPMQRMVVTFTLRPGLQWSNGVPLTADDSVFSFELAADPATPTDKHIIARTADYRAVNAHKVIWRGVPGFQDQSYWLNFWHPLPRHTWGRLSATQLLTSEVSTQRPVGWGPFTIREWVAGDHITAVRNPFYFRTAEGLPRVDRIIFRFIAEPSALAEQLLSGECDIVTHEAADEVLGELLSGEQQTLPPQIQALPVQDTRWELLAFGISPALGYERPDFFEDVRVRQGIARCIDREAITGEVLGEAGRVLHTYLPPEHPLYAGESLTTWSYDPEAGQKLLAQAGWYDEDGDGVREAHNIPGVADGVPLRVAYHLTDDPLRVRTAQLIHEHLDTCGVQTELAILPAEALFAPGPEGVLFGRRFDLAQFSWRAASVSLCDLFISSRMPDAGRWNQPNMVGFLDDEYDTACRAALEASPGSEQQRSAEATAQRIFSERLPALPLFQYPKITLARTSVTGLIPDSTMESELWNIEEMNCE